MHFSTLTVAIVSLLASDAAAAPTIYDASFQRVALETHNIARANHGVPPLQWDPTLAQFAQNWANNCEFKHSNGPYGENLYGMWTSRPFNHLSATQSGIHDGWYNELALYDFDRPGFSAATGHFTQVVWKSTRRVGCAWNTRACMSNGLPFYKLVCEYDPPGNVVGSNGRWFVENVPRLVGTETETENVTGRGLEEEEEEERDEVGEAKMVFEGDAEGIVEE